MAVKIKHGQALAMLSLTALINCVIILLILLVVAPKIGEHDKKVRLPNATMARPITLRPQDIFVNINEHGQMTVGGNYLSLRELERYLTQAKADNPLGQNVRIRADHRASVQAAVDVFNACNKAGIDSYSVTTDATLNPT